MAETQYTDRFTIQTDLTLYLYSKVGGKLTLNLFPRLAADRWTWFVRNKQQLTTRFETYANGDEFLVNAISVFHDFIESYENGANVNPFLDLNIFAEMSELLSLIEVDSLQLTDPENAYIKQEVQRAAQLEASDFREMLNFLKTQREIAFDFIGLGDTYYDSIRGRKSAPKQRDYFISDLVVLNNTIELEKYIEGLIIEFKYKKNVAPNLLEFANARLDESNSEVRVQDIYQSYKVVPFEKSLHQMAQDYLGDAERWYELVTTNNLKAPYVDLTGEKILLLESGSASTVRIPISQQDKFRINSVVKIGSRLVPEEVRKVEQVNDNRDGSATVFLSGKQDLAKLLIKHVPYVRAYKPETLNDFSLVKIPSTAIAPNKNIPEPSDGELKKLDKALLSFGVDVAVDDVTGDLLIGTDGDIKYQFGINNLRQAVISVLKTEQGQLPLHREYGIPNSVGFSLQGDTTSTRIAAIVEEALKRDLRFTSVTLKDIQISPDGTIGMTTLVTIAGSNQLIPLAFVL
jgi:phage baseplate assembly protein W